MAEHPITKILQRLEPPLAPGESIEAYIAASDHPGPPARHAFAVVFHFSSGREPIVISPPQSRSPGTHSQRGNVGAVLTLFEWLNLNQAQAHFVTVYSLDKFIVNIRHSVQARKSKMGTFTGSSRPYSMLGPLSASSGLAMSVRRSTMNGMLAH